MWFEAMHPSWQQALADQKSVLDALENTLAGSADITPDASQVMRAFELPLERVRVLIIGQDPYPAKGVACGLAFAVSPETQPLPASLRNILKELASDLPGTAVGGRIENWQAQGVLLLNRHLTTQVGTAGAHSKIGWTTFTDAVVRALVANRGANLVAILWGNQAQEVESLLGSVAAIKSAHPSPLSASRGFFGSRPFSRVNAELQKLGLPSVDWSS